MNATTTTTKKPTKTKKRSADAVEPSTGITLTSDRTLTSQRPMASDCTLTSKKGYKITALITQIDECDEPGIHIDCTGTIGCITGGGINMTMSGGKTKIMLPTDNQDLVINCVKGIGCMNTKGTVTMNF